MVGTKVNPIWKSSVSVDVSFSSYSEACSRLQHESIIWQTQIWQFLSKEKIKTHTHCFSNTLFNFPAHPSPSLILPLSLTSAPPMATTTWLRAEEQLVSCQLTGGTLPQMNQLIYTQHQAISVQNVHRQWYSHSSLSVSWYSPCKSRALLLLQNALFEEEIHLLQWISR